jgi:hypothetical protein
VGEVREGNKDGAMACAAEGVRAASADMVGSWDGRMFGVLVSAKLLVSCSNWGKTVPATLSSLC